MTSKIKVDNITDQDDNNIINESGDVITVGAAGDTVAVAGNIVKSNAYQASDGGNIVNQSGTTITIGASGDTVSLASGASQSGFGRSGSVDWQTSIKTSNFDAVSGEGYFINTTSGGVTVTLPASPSAGAIVAVKDYANTADTNAISIARNGSNIDGAANNVDLITEGGSVVLVYADATKGWLVVESAQKSDLITPLFVTASGGTETTSGDFKIHTFTGPGTFTVSCAGNTAGSSTVDYLVIAGGGGGGTSGNPTSSHGGSGGGAGGYRFSTGVASGCYPVGASPISPLGASALPVSAQGYPITVGGSGAGRGHPSSSPGTQGGTSTFSTISSAGGGGGGSRTPSGGSDGGDGGSGGGGNTGSAVGSGNTPPVSPPQGNDGGDTGGPQNGGGGGGGAAAVGGNGAADGGDGGAGISSSITASPVARGGGGGGGTSPGFSGGTGTSGGGNGAHAGSHGGAGTANTGGGGGGASRSSNSSDGGNGGSGVVIIRYKFQ